MMKRQLLSISLVIACLSVTATAETDDPQIYVNQNLGFNVEGYKYAQSELPCDIDKVLVGQIVQKASAKDMRMEAVGTADKLRNGIIPVLAIDIEALVLGSDEYTFGTRSRSNLPSVKVTAALIQKDLPGGIVTAKHSCAIATLNDLTPSSNVMDLGTYGYTVCSATHKCLKDLSNDIVGWVEPQIR